MADITSANVIFLLTIPQVATAVQLQQFRVDDAFLFEPTEAAEVHIGVDGWGVSGYVPRAPMCTIGFEAFAASINLFEQWQAAEDQMMAKIEASAIITYPSISRKYTCARGVLMRSSNAPDARKVLGAREFRLQWLPSGPGVPAVSGAPM